MLLAVDVGNTETVLGVFSDRELTRQWRISTVADRTADELALMFGGLLEHQDLSFDRNVTAVVIASVVPTATQALREMVRRYFGFRPLVVEPGVKTGIPVLTDNPKEVGADRVLNAVAAIDLHGSPAIVVDFGTATNFDVVSERGEFVGGVIAPGLQASAASLFSRTARLTRVELAPPENVVGTSTVEALQSGLIYGTAGQVDAIVGRIRAELPQATTIATGGLASVVIPHCTTIDRLEPWLTLIGLRLVFERNVETAE